MSTRNVAETIFTGSADDLVAEFQRLREEQRKNDHETREAAKAAREANRAEKQDLREKEQMLRSIQSPLEQYKEAEKRIEAQFKAGNISLEQRNRLLEQEKAKMQQAEAQSNKTAAAVKKFVGAFAGFIGVQSLIRAVNSEMEHLRKLAEDARLENLDFAQVVANTRNAFAADETLSAEGLEQRMIDAGQAARTSPKIFAAAMQDVFSAKGDATNEEAVQAAIAAFRLNPGDLDSGRTIASRALDVRQATGSTDFMANIGFLQNLQQNARVTDLASVGQHLVPGLAAIMTRGDTAEQAGEIVTTLNTLMQDAEGRRTRTAAINLSTKLREFAPEDKAARARFAAAGSTTERLNLLQGDRSLAQEFLDKNPFEAAAQAFIEQLVLGDEKALAVQADKRAKIRPLDAAQGQALEEQIREKEASQRAQLLAAEQASAVAEESGKLSDTERAREGQARAVMERVFSNINQGGIDALNNFVLRREFQGRVSLGQDPVAAAKNVLTGQISAENLTEGDQEFLSAQLKTLDRIANGVEGLKQAPRPPAAAQGR